MTQEQQIQEKISTLIENIKHSLIETKRMRELSVDYKFDSEDGEVSLDDLFDFSKMDIEGYIQYLYISNQEKDVFGDLSRDLILVLFCGDKPVVSKKIMTSLVKSYLK